MNAKNAASLLSVCWLLLAGPAARGEYFPPFNLEECIYRSSLVARVEIDEGGLIVKVDEVFKGDPKFAGNVRIDENFLPEKGKPCEAVLFLHNETGKWEPVLQYMGVAELRGDEVKLPDIGKMLYPAGGPKNFTRAAFLDAVRAEVKESAKLDRLLGLPPGAERTRLLIAFALRHGDAAVDAGVENAIGDRDSASFDFRRIEQSFRTSETTDRFGDKRMLPPAKDDEAALLAALKAATDGREQALLLRMAGEIPLSPAAYDAVEPYTAESHPAAVRHAAIGAIHCIAPDSATARLAASLDIKEPELLTMLNNLGSGSQAGGALDPAVMERLARLAGEMRDSAKIYTAQSPGDDYSRISNIRSRLMDEMARYAHPRFAAVLYDWAMAARPAGNADPTLQSIDRDAALRGLQQITGLNYARADADAWTKWWQAARPRLEMKYDLATSEGRAAWAAQWDAADEGTRRLLARLWWYEPKPDEKALLAEAEKSAAIRGALGELWKQGRLSPDTCKQLVERFFSVTLVELPNPSEDPKKFPTARRLAVKAHSDFPFPPDMLVTGRCLYRFGQEGAAGNPHDTNGGFEEKLSVLEERPFAGIEGEYPDGMKVRALFELKPLDRPAQIITGWQAEIVPQPLELRAAGK
ncbi:MAG TPA: hypothetical protein VG733_08395 [Chthoniobacteraceae bacterium]|nr:hypothetical protein [Chthoniobacteraceae bacterium]